MQEYMSLFSSVNITQMLNICGDVSLINFVLLSNWGLRVYSAIERNLVL